MRILFVGMPDSIHVVRWISQLAGLGWEIYLYPVYLADTHAAFRDINVFGARFWRPQYLEKSVNYIRWSSVFFYLDEIKGRMEKQFYSKFKNKALTSIIRYLKPDIVHSLEFQRAGYMALTAREELGGESFPTWIATNWGSDIYLFGRLDEHRKKVQAVLQTCDFYSCECERDVYLAKELGLRGQSLPIFPNSGGFHLDQVLVLRSDLPTSSRRLIILKGYQNWAGRALVALQALRMCQELLKDYSVAIFSASPETKIAAELFSQDTGIPAHLVLGGSHEEILRWHARSRIYIGLSISDAISTSLLEAILMGAFPIQSCTSCADEWISDGESGFIVPPEDPYVVADAIRKALTDDTLVNRAAEINLQVAKERLDYSIIQPKVIQMYQDICAVRKEEYARTNSRR